MKMKSLLLALITALFLASCASKKPGNNQDNAQDGDSSSAYGSPLELNGDSDNRAAGGLRTIFFSVDNSTLNDESRAILKENAAFLEKYSNITIQIEGHADERGGRQYNLALGEKRANAVREYLKALGIKADRISTISYGNEKPMVEGHDESSWSKNRRGNFVVTSK